MGAPSPAVAPPPGNPRFPAFDGLRGIAVLAVVVFHVWLVSGALARRGTGDAVTVLGSHGPILFFVISGFLLHRPFVTARTGSAGPPSVARYALRRALRILPAYWVALALLGVHPGLAGVFEADWWRYWLFLQLYDADTLGRGIPVAWTLCIEVTFYLALPLWALATRRCPARAELTALAAVALGGAAVQVAAGRGALPDLAAQSLVGQSPWFALGMALAVGSVAAPRGRLAAAVGRAPGRCWAGAALAFAGLAALRWDTGGVLGIVQALARPQPVAELLAELVLTAALMGLLVAPAVFGGGGLPGRVLAAAPLAWLGVVSYGVYLWHLTIAEWLALPAVPQHFAAEGLDLARDLPAPVLLVLVLAASVAVAAVSYRGVELPFLALKDRDPAGGRGRGGG